VATAYRCPRLQSNTAHRVGLEVGSFTLIHLFGPIGVFLNDER
jgi:hypothetical protein